MDFTIAEDSTFSVNIDMTTSPSQLQEVTLDPNASANGTIPFTMGVRSPGKTSPIRGRTMKEYEDQLSQLKKENFNLKLRIYFLEERMGHMNDADDKEDPIKKNIELKVEAETLRKEVSDKQDLLCQAAKALDLMEEQHRSELKRIQQERDMEKGMVETRIQELENGLKEFQSKMKDPFPKFEDSTVLINEAFGLSPSNVCVDHHTREEVENLQHHIEELESQVQQLECSLQEETVRSSQLEADLQEAQQESERVGVRCQGLELELKQRDCKLEDLVQELEERGQDLAGCNLRIRTLEEALSAKEPEIQIKVQELCERDRIIEEKQSQIEQQNKILVEIQITLDEKQRQIEALRSSLAARDSSIADLENRLAKAKANARNLEAKLDASVHEANRLREEVETLKAQQKRINSRSREQMQQELDLLSPLRRRSGNLSSISDEKTSSGRRTRPSSDEDGTLRKKMLELKEKEERLKILDDRNKELKTQLEGARKKEKSYEDRVKHLESKYRDIQGKLQESEKLKEKDSKSKNLEEEHLKACHAIKSFMKRAKETGYELEKLRSEVRKKDRRICDLMSELNELRDACNKANWEARQLEAQANMQGGGGMPGAFENVHDMTEEENERLWAEVEDKNKKVAQLTKERDSLSIEMEKQVQALITSLKEKEMLLEDYEKKATALSSDLAIRDNRIKELEDDLKQLTHNLEELQVQEHKLQGSGDGGGTTVDTKADSVPGELELEDNKCEVERLTGEFQKRNGNLQELVNKELWDKNREIEKLQDRLNSICERKELEIMSLQQQVSARDFQLKMLQDKVAELGIHVNLPTSLMLREFQQIPVSFSQHIHLKQSSNDDALKIDISDVSKDEIESSTVSSSVPTPKDEVSYLRDQLQASIEERKYLCCKIEELRERLRNTPERDSDSRTLRSECARLREEIDRANVWRKEAGEACSLLTRRLEELAGFLSTLLRHPEQLGGLGSKHRQLLKQAVERSMELSRTLSVSLCIKNQDISNNSLPPLMDSFSSLLMSASDSNFSFGDIVQREEGDETSSYDPAQQDNFISSGISPHETTPTSQYFRSSGSNSEIAQIQMRDSITSEENYPSAGKIVGDQAHIIAQLRSQVEILTNEIKQRDIEYSKSQKDGLNMIVRPEAPTVSGARSRSTSPSKSSVSSVWKSRTETEKLGEFEETKDSLSSMTFYNSHHLSNIAGEHWNGEPQPKVSEQSVPNETKAMIGASPVSHQEKQYVAVENVKRSASSPIKSPHAAKDVEFHVAANDVGKHTPKKQDYQKSTKSPLTYKMSRSSSASAVALSQLQQSVQHQDVAAGSLSESEAWSEPDRNVSLARIGLNEESAKAVLSPAGNGCTVSSSRPRNGRIIQEETETSESSEETAHEISRFQGKRGRSDTGEVRRLQNRLRALEQVNEALRAELTIMHQLNPPPPPPPPLTPPPENNERPLTCDVSINTSTKEEKLDKPTSAEHIENREHQNSSITIPMHLLDQIRFQREKLESSLYHNDLIRRQLEGIITSLSGQGDDTMMNLWQKMKETAEQLEEARHQCQDLESRLQEMGVQLEASKEQARLASEANEQLQVTRQTVTIIQEQVTSLEARLREKDNEILEKKCQMLELENQAKQQIIETEKMVQETTKLKEDAESQIKAAEKMKLEAEAKLQEAQQLVSEAEKAKLDAENKMKNLEKQFKVAEMQIKEAEIQFGAVNEEKEKIQKENEAIHKDREAIQVEKDVIKKEKETIRREKEMICKDRESFQKEKEKTRKEVEESIKEIQSIAHDAKIQKEEAEKQIKTAKNKILEAEALKQEAEIKVKSAEEMVTLIGKRNEEMLQVKTKEMEVELAQWLHEAKKTLEKEWVSKAEMEKKIRETERLGKEFEAGLKCKIENAEKQVKEIRVEADIRIKTIEEKSKEREMELKKCLQESEKHFREKDRELRKQLDEMTLTTSQAALERTRLANEKLHLEQEVRRHETREAELVQETKEAETRLCTTKERLEKEIRILQQQKNDLEKCVKELEAANRELKERLSSLHLRERSSYSISAEPNSGHISGPDSTSSMAHMKMGGISPGSYSSGLDLLTGEGGSLPISPWGTTGTASLEYSGSQNEDREHFRDRSRRGSDGGRSGGLTALSNLVLQHGFSRQRSELSDYMSEDQTLEEYEALFSQTRSSSYWVTSLTEQHSTPSINVPGDPSTMRNINSSPDLGIESDQGRFSSLEATSSGIQQDTSKMLSTMEGYNSDMDHTIAAVVINSRGDASTKSYKELEQENVVLKRRLMRTHRALEETLAHLTAANQRKKQVERAICKQLHKTHHILKRARVNLDTEAMDFVGPSAEELE